MNRIDKKFQDLRNKREPAFIPFISAGDPDLPTTKSLILELEKRGADVIELGFPFSDPIADGPIIQASYYRALSKGQKVSQIFDLISDIRKSASGGQIPIVSMASYSIVFKSGCERFIETALNAGLDGATIPDLPIEESDEVFKIAEKKDFKIVCFVAPTTTEHRRDIIARKSQGFIYYISVVGITGVRDTLPTDMIENIRKLRQLTNTPISIGFGVSTPEQAKTVGQIADGVIVGSAIIKMIEKYQDKSLKELVQAVGDFAENLIIGAKEARTNKFVHATL
ncbi:MAG TPA: tryptophan synthase subunit alpha [Candidatus Brocadiia bacterium]|nr:tryptophan synthase subunit alpha [Candidatus Brocadiales bacterium]